MRRKAAVLSHGGCGCGELFLLLLHLGEALRAVDRAVLTGLEGDPGLTAAVGADSGVHLALGAGVVLAGVAAGLAALGLVDEASLSVELLFTSGENELGSTFFACECFVLVHFDNLA